jgi:hypothetical protein
LTVPEDKEKVKLKLSLRLINEASCRQEMWGSDSPLFLT